MTVTTEPQSSRLLDASPTRSSGGLPVAPSVREAPKGSRKVRQGPAGLFAIIGALVLTVVPIVWMVLASLRSRNDLYSQPLRILPGKLVWNNYHRAFDEVPFFGSS